MPDTFLAWLARELGSNDTLINQLKHDVEHNPDVAMAWIRNNLPYWLTDATFSHTGVIDPTFVTAEAIFDHIKRTLSQYPVSFS